MFGPPNILMSDMGKEFLNNIMNQVCERFKIIRTHTSSYNPRADGQTERTIQTVTRLLTKHCLENPKDWPNTLNIVLEK